MKAIMISIKPKYVAHILNGHKVVEIRKTIPKCKLPIDVYIYCTKDNKNGLYWTDKWVCVDQANCVPSIRNGKVVAKFTLKDIKPCYDMYEEEICDLACISTEELYDYAGGWCEIDELYAWFIDDLEIFDQPKELSEFWHETITRDNCKGRKISFEIIEKAPQSWGYIEL